MPSSLTHHQASPPKGAGPECCTESKCESGLRNRYFEGKRLTPYSFQVEQRYSLERRHLLNRAIHGWGVVYGFKIDIGSEHCQHGIRVGAGLALDECGRELLEAGTLLQLSNVIWLNQQGIRSKREDVMKGWEQTYGHPAECWLLSVHYAEQYIDPITVTDRCNCPRKEWDRICETVRYSLQAIDCDDCCEDIPCELNCDCGTGECCEENAARGKRGGCRCLCDHLTNLLPECECSGLCEIDEPCGRIKVDLRNRVALACIRLIQEDCEWKFEAIEDDCGPRRLVKRNDLLFDLIRGCDLTYIEDIGWKDWHRRDEPVPLQEFSEALGPDVDKQPEYVSNGFWVRFSRPVRAETVRPDCFAMTVISGEREGAWWQTFRVPILRIETDAVTGGLVNEARMVFDGDWVGDAVRGRAHIFRHHAARVEIEVRGDFIVDCNGQTVDANALGLSPPPTGNGTPGGTFVSTFVVQKSTAGSQ